MWLLYQALLATLTLLVGPVLLIRRGHHYLESLSARLGNVPSAAPGSLWIHAVSVGEVNVATSLASILPSNRKLVVTTITPSGQTNARVRFPQAIVTYLPFDLGFAVRSFFDRLQPAALILCEGDLWPLILRETSRRGTPVVVVNGRLSERSFRRMRLLGRFVRPLLGPIEGFGMQTREDGRRLEELGVRPDRISVTGNLKFEIKAAPPLPELESAIRRLAQSRPILVAGSTMRGEEELVLDAFDQLGGGSRALLVLAPRHPERWARVAAALSKRGMRTVVRSQIDSEDPEDPVAALPPDVLLLDSHGELASVYRLGAAVLIGGTLVPTGGHNPLEAARHGVPVASGPSMHNFQEIADRFDADRAWGRVGSSRELGDLWDRWLGSPEAAAELGARGARLVEINRGAAAKTAAFLHTHLGDVLGEGSNA